AIIESDTIRTPEIVADVDIRRSIPIEVAKHDRQSPILRTRRQGLAVFIQKISAAPRHGRKMSLAVVEIKRIDLAVLQQKTFRSEFVLLAVIGSKDELAVDVQNRQTGAAN